MNNKFYFCFIFLILLGCASKLPTPSKTSFSSTWIKTDHKPHSSEDSGKISIRVVSDGVRFNIDEMRQFEESGKVFLKRTIIIFDGKDLFRVRLPILSSQEDNYEFSRIEFANLTDRLKPIEKSKAIGEERFWVIPLSSKITSGETISGRKTNIWTGQVHHRFETNQTVKAWVDNETGFSLKMEIQERSKYGASVFSNIPDDEFTIECKSIDYGPLQNSDSVLFNLPDQEQLRLLDHEWFEEFKKLQPGYRVNLDFKSGQ